MVAEVRTQKMGGQTDSTHKGSPDPNRVAPAGPTPCPAGPVLAILTTAPRPGLALAAACPPLTPTEAGALQTAWLKHIVQELPGVAVMLCGTPADAMPMLRYFAGPGVQLRGWPVTAGEPTLALARELFAAGHGPVLIRTGDAPEPQQGELLACLAAARDGHFVWAPDQRGGAWLCGFASLAQVEAVAAGGLAAATPRWPGPWARRVVDGLDWLLLLEERARRHGLPAGPLRLPVQNLQASLQFYEAQCSARLLERQATCARIEVAGIELWLQATAVPFLPNGLWLELPAQTANAAPGSSSFGMVRGGQTANAGDHAIAATVVDPDGNHLTFGEAAPAR